MNSLHAVSASKNNNTERTAQPVCIQRVKFHGRLMIALYPLCCYFWTHLLRADCSFNHFLPCTYYCPYYQGCFKLVVKTWQC